MTYRIVAVYLVLIFSWQSAASQTKKKDPDRLYQHPKYILKAAASSLMDVANPAVQVSLEQFFTTKNSLQYEIGGIWARYPYDEAGYGYTLRSEFRHYFKPIAAGDADNYYYALQGTWRQVLTTRYDWVDRYDGAYSQKIQYNNRRNIAILTYNMGGLWYITPNLIFEIGVGLGIRYIQIRNVGLPEDAVFRDDLFEFPVSRPQEEGNYIKPAGSFVLKFGRVF